MKVDVNEVYTELCTCFFFRKLGDFLSSVDLKITSLLLSA